MRARAPPATVRSAAERMRILLICVAIAVAIYLISGGHVLFLPLLLFLPLGFAGHRRRGRTWR